MDAESPNTQTPGAEPAPAHPLQVLIDHELATYGTLQDLFIQERQLLTDRDFAELAEVLTRKQALINRLEICSKTRAALLSEAGYSVDREGLEAMFMTMNANTKVATEEAWTELNTRVAECRRLNEINARIAHRGHLNNVHVLDILRGEPNKPKLYGPSGAAKGTSTTDSITRA